jgi:hypothetical protein
MSIPASREQLKYYCLRKLGNEVIDINVSDNQVEDRIDEALLFWQDWNSDATFRHLYKYSLTTQDIANRFITLPDNIIGAISVFDLGGGMNAMDIFDIRYQIALNDLYTLTSVSMVPFYMAFQHIALLEQLLVGFKPVRYNRHSQEFHIDMDWATLIPGYWVVVDCYAVVNSTTYPSVWGDRMLQDYATALIKKQWGSNLKKFGNMQMPGGITFNGQVIFDEAVKEIDDIDQQIRNRYQMPAEIFIG